MSNYTSQMVARINAEAPLNLTKAKALAEEFGNVTYRSVISKAQSIGVEYVKLSPVKRVKRDDMPTKAPQNSSDSCQKPPSVQLIRPVAPLSLISWVKLSLFWSLMR